MTNDKPAGSGEQPGEHEHGDWDQGGYCNRLVLDANGDGDTCGYRPAPAVLTDPETVAGIAEVLAEHCSSGWSRTGTVPCACQADGDARLIWRDRASHAAHQAEQVAAYLRATAAIGRVEALAAHVLATRSGLEGQTANEARWAVAEAFRVALAGSGEQPGVVRPDER